MLDKTLAFTESVAALFLLLVAALTFFNVCVRYLFDTQIPDWFDLSKQLQAIAILWGIALATYRGSHICVDILWEHCGRVWRRRIDIFATCVTLLLLAPMAWMIWIMVGNMGSEVTSDLRLPLHYFYSIAAVGAVVAAVLAGKRILVLYADRSPGVGATERPDG
ncbi:MAG: TRAP transporter small permease [Burkholderiales bacterium]|nr:TRAP transporter small permease [Burkholderiales bacterium]